jgi:hypothetical protein
MVLKNGWVMISMNPDSRLHPKRSAGFLLRKPLSIEAAFTLSERGMRMVFSKITAKNTKKIRSSQFIRNKYHRVWVI